MQPIYIVYGRFSGEGQRGNSSVERQMDMDYYHGRADELGLPFVEIPFFDDAKSGYHGDNLEAELGKIFGDIRSGRIPPGSVIGTESHSRLGRLSANEALYQYLDILRTGTKLDIKGRALRTWDSIGGLSGVLTLMEDFIDMVIAHKHSADLAKTERDTNQIKRRQVQHGERSHTMKKGGPGWFVGHRCPAWLTPLDNEIEIDGRFYMYQPNEIAKIVRMIFDWADQGLGTVVIARRLTEKQVAPLGNAHRKNPDKMLSSWSPGMVGALLKNRAVIGEWQPTTRTREKDGKKLKYSAKVAEGDPILHYYPPIIDRAVFDRVQRGLELRRGYDGKPKGGRTGNKFGNIILHLGSCGCCGGTVTLWSRSADPKNPRRGGPMKYLRCEVSRRKRTFPEGHKFAGMKCPNKHGFQYPRFEELLFSLFSPAMIPVIEDLLPQSQQNEIATRRLAECELQIGQHQQQIRNLVKMVARAATALVADAYHAEIEATQAALDRLQVECGRLRREATAHEEDQQAQIAAAIADLQDAADAEVLYERRAKLNRLLARYIRVILHDDVSLTIRISEHSGLNPVEVQITPDGVESIRVMDRDGSVLTDFGKAGLLLLEPIADKGDAALAA
ncbi:MAG TPA: recombinase family protein [Stellaceae bacterium]|nr:recombinase family protein [Stellaceae bacterium]